MPKMSNLDKAKMEIVMERFDFEFIHDLMDKVNWAWACRDGGMAIPSLDMIRDTAYTLLKEAYDGGDCSTGGLYAEYKDGNFSLKFIAEEEDSHIDSIENEEIKEKQERPKDEDSLKNENAITLLGD